MSSTQPGLGRQIGRGLAWSSVNSLVLRVGSLAVGIVLARLLAPEQFGVFAVALTVQAVLMTIADLGMSADLVRSADPGRKAPTVASLGLASGALLAITVAFSGQGIGELLGSPASGPVISVMAFSLLLAGAGVVPYAMLQRRFAQKQLFGIAVADFLIGTALTIVLILSGWGVMGLAVGRLVSQAVALVLQFVFSGERMRYGFDRSVAPEVLSFGLPVAGANMLSWVLLNVDNVAISRLAGPVALGFYFLAFNVSNWPMSALGQVVRSISMPAFARVARGSADRSFAVVLGPTWALSLLAGLMLATLARPVIDLVYGTVWLPAAAILAWLGIFGALRTLFDLSASYLLARGASTPTLLVQIVWIAGLIPAVLLGIHTGGTTGVAVAHLATAAAVVCPAYALALHRSGADLRAVAARMWPPLTAAVPATAAAVAALEWAQPSPAGILAGALAGTAVYALLLGRWFWRQIREFKDWMPEDSPTPSGTAAQASPARGTP
ncbi:lipopolysaccharide biosynthesis protein [Arthrobacter sp. EPSL27]|uniref:lipopolysaccharide biosynthesis protein n=1 Tax=Arthrobacter sp. EPSL27 TaxID=1745378 RepID=UPI000AE601DA|nr:lipopolysaccharide biosynthesis protein [Arthrobacter sp. EPSL27]